MFFSSIDFKNTKTLKFSNDSKVKMDHVTVCLILVQCSQGWQKYYVATDIKSNPGLLIILHDAYFHYPTDELTRFKYQD